jgi:hypothetical protein
MWTNPAYHRLGKLDLCPSFRFSAPVRCKVSDALSGPVFGLQIADRKLHAGQLKSLGFEFCIEWMDQGEQEILVSLTRTGRHRDRQAGGCLFAKRHSSFEDSSVAAVSLAMACEHTLWAARSGARDGCSMEKTICLPTHHAP